MSLEKNQKSSCKVNQYVDSTEWKLVLKVNIDDINIKYQQWEAVFSVGIHESLTSGCLCSFLNIKKIFFFF